MPPLDFLPIGAFMGTDESIPSLQIAAVFSSGGNKNTYLDKLGRIRTILGYTQQTLVAPVSHTTAMAMHGRGLCAYGKRVGNAVTRQLLAVFDNDNDAWEVHVSYDAGVSWQFLVAFDATVVGAIPDFAQLGDTLILTNSQLVSDAYQWDGNALTAVANTQLAAPVAFSAGAGQLSGNYTWKVVPVTTTGVRKYASVASNLLPLANKKATVGWVADADVTVGSYEIYRTRGTGKVYYYEGTVVGRLTVTFTTNLHDLEIIANRALAEHGDKPVAGFGYCEAHSQRMWYGVTATAPRTWYFSDPGLPTSVYSENFIDFTDAESFTDIGKGAVGNYKKMFVAFLERSIWTVSGSGIFNGPTIDYTRFRTNAITGTVSHRTVAKVPQGARFRNAKGETQVTEEVVLAYLTPRMDIRVFDGLNDTIISFPMADTLKRLTYAQRHKAYVLTDKARGEFTWIFPADGATEPTLGVSWNYRFGTWDQRTIWPFGHAIDTDAADESSVILAVESRVATGALVYKLWNGVTANGAAIAWRMMTTTLYGVGRNYTQPTLSGQPLVSFDKRWRWVDILMQLASTSGVLVEWLPGEAGDDDAAYGSTTVVNTLQALKTADGQPILTADGSAIDVPVESLHPFRVLLDQGTGATFSGGGANPRYLHARGMRLRLSGSSLVGGFIGIGMLIAYQVLEGLKRTFRR